MKKLTLSQTILLMFLSYVSFSQNSLGTIAPTTNPALPSVYNFQEYVFPEPGDQGTCQGIQNATATTNEVFLAQTHRHAIGHPLLFTIGERPTLLQIAVTPTGLVTDVQVEGLLKWQYFMHLVLKESS